MSGLWGIGYFTNFPNPFYFTDGPLPPNISVLTIEHLFNNTFRHKIQWEEPFTWAEFPITGYELNITNHSLYSGETTHQVLLLSNESSDSPGLSYLITSSGNHCYSLDVAVSAINAIGNSDPGTLHTGHPTGMNKKCHSIC